MPTVIDTELTEIEGQTLRIRKSHEPAQKSRLLLLIHGFTGDENSMWVFARDLPSHYWIVAPRAPYMAAAGGYSWRSDQTPDLSLSGFERLQPTVDALIHIIDAYQVSVGLDVAQPFDMVGFSQGAAMCSLLAFLCPTRIRRLGLLAGFIPSSLEPLANQHPLEGKGVFIAHGTNDDTVRIDQARAAKELLEKSGAQVTYCEDDTGHKVSLTCLHALRKFLAA